MARTNYIWDEENDTLLMETDESGNTIAEYTHEPGRYGPLISQRRNGHTYYHHYDGQGSTRALTDESGNVTDRYTFTAFGEPVSSTGTTTNPFGYKGTLGYYANPETNDLYVRARTYSPAIGRWLSQDPIREEENVYRYVRNGSVASVDPSGQLRVRPPVTEPDLDPAPPFPCANIEWWPKLCPCCKCSSTKWGKTFDPNVAAAEMRNKLGNLPQNVTVKFVAPSGNDPSGRGYSLSCFAVRPSTAPQRRRGRPNPRERHVFLYVTNRNTCEALAMLVHEAQHMQDFSMWTKGQKREGVSDQDRKIMERKAYEAQCKAQAEQDCITGKIPQYQWVQNCIRDLIDKSLTEQALAQIGSGCMTLVGQERGGWTSV